MKVDIFLVLVLGESPAEVNSLFEHLNIKRYNGLCCILWFLRPCLGGLESPLPSQGLHSVAVRVLDGVSIDVIVIEGVLPRWTRVDWPLRVGLLGDALQM